MRSLAARLGLGDVEPAVLRLAKHSVVRLGPLVARVQSAGDVGAALASMRREVSVAAHLAAAGAPVTPPSREPPHGPYSEAGCAISLWAFVPHRPAEARDAAAAGAALKQVHDALATYAGELPPFTDSIASCAALLADPTALAAAPDDRTLLADTYAGEVAALDADRGGWVALHGDTHLGNVFVTDAGPIWSDFEAVCRGPLEWDLTNQSAVFLRPFGKLDPARLRRLARLRRTCVAIWCWADAERSFEMRAAAELHTAWLRRQPAASRFA